MTIDFAEAFSLSSQAEATQRSTIPDRATA
jgi:hypothetical protein